MLSLKVYIQCFKNNKILIIKLIIILNYYYKIVFITLLILQFLPMNDKKNNPRKSINEVNNFLKVKIITKNYVQI